jgi:hypothetical protein
MLLVFNQHLIGVIVYTFYIQVKLFLLLFDIFVYIIVLWTRKEKADHQKKIS